MSYGRSSYKILKDNLHTKMKTSTRSLALDHINYYRNNSFLHLKKVHFRYLRVLHCDLQHHDLLLFDHLFLYSNYLLAINYKLTATIISVNKFSGGKLGNVTFEQI